MEISTVYLVVLAGLSPRAHEMVMDVVFTANVVPSVKGSTANVAVANSVVKGLELLSNTEATCP